jgi:hypothetical protein
MAAIREILNKHGVELPSEAKPKRGGKRQRSAAELRVEGSARDLRRTVRIEAPDMAAVAPHDADFQGCGDPFCTNCKPTPVKGRFAWWFNAMARLRVRLLTMLFTRLLGYGEQTYLATRIMKHYMPEKMLHLLAAAVKADAIVEAKGPQMLVATSRGYVGFDLEGAIERAKEGDLINEEGVEFLENVRKMRDQIAESVLASGAFDTGDTGGIRTEFDLRGRGKRSGPTRH